MFRLLVLAAVLGCTACASGSSEDPFFALAKKCDAAPSASTCAAAGNYLWDNNGKKLRSCKNRLAISCQRDNEDRVSAIRRIDKIASEYHDRACLFGDAGSCNKAGVALAVESSLAPEDAAPELARQAEVRFEKACKLGFKDGCRNVGSTRPAK